MPKRRIITEHIYPAIPVRSFDWAAYYVGDEEQGPHGWGETEAAAIKDLEDAFPDAGMEM